MITFRVSEYVLKMHNFKTIETKKKNNKNKKKLKLVYTIFYEFLNF